MIPAPNRIFSYFRFDSASAYIIATQPFLLLFLSLSFLGHFGFDESLGSFPSLILPRRACQRVTRYYTSPLRERVIVISNVYMCMYVYVHLNKSKAGALEREKEWRLSRRRIHRPGSRVNEPRTPRGGSRLRSEKRRERIESRRAAKKEESEET